MAVRSHTSRPARDNIGRIALATAVLLLPACAPDPPAATGAPPPALAAHSRSVEVATTVAFTEGPTADEAGNVYFTDIPNSRIMRFSTEGDLTTFRQPSHRANGLIFDSEWRLLACEGGDGDTVLPRVTRTNVDTGEIEVIADGYEGKQLHQPNDLTFDGRGRIYFTDRPGPNPTPEQTGVHGVYRIDPDGTIERILTEPEIERPNGIVISPDDRTLYLIEANRRRGRRAHDPRLRLGRGRHGQCHASLSRLLPGPQRRRYDDRQRGQPLGGRRPQSASEAPARRSTRRPASTCSRRTVSLPSSFRSRRTR